MEPKRAYVTLATRASYLAGVIVLAATLRDHGSRYPLVVLYTSSLDPDARRALDLESRASNLIPREIEALLPPGEVPLIAERFADTWTKLRVFEIPDFDEVCYLDADMTINNRNMDAVFEWMPPASSSAPCRRQPGRASDWLAASHACVCNLDHDAWAPDSWAPQNCAFTPLSHPAALARPTPIHPDSPAEHDLLNGGLLLFRPSPRLWHDLLATFHAWGASGALATFNFPDQDFLAAYFRGRWRPVPWCFNALKTWRYWHPGLWRDDEVVCLHYIVDKPWAERVGQDGRAGYSGRDGETHRWWWVRWEAWVRARERGGDGEVVRLVSAYVAGGADDAALNAIGAGVQDFAKRARVQGPVSVDRDGRTPRCDVGGGREGESGSSVPRK